MAVRNPPSLSNEGLPCLSRCQAHPFWCAHATGAVALVICPVGIDVDGTAMALHYVHRTIAL